MGARRGANEGNSGEAVTARRERVTGGVDRRGRIIASLQTMACQLYILS